MAINFDYETERRQRNTADAYAHTPVIGNRLKPADPEEPPPPTPVLNMRPRRHDVVRWAQDGFVTKTSHETKEQALEYAQTLHWATTWKWAVMCGRELIERKELQEPADYDAQVRAFFMSRNGIA